MTFHVERAVDVAIQDCAGQVRNVGHLLEHGHERVLRLTTPVAAAYLAAAGSKVVVLERQPWFGGGVITKELTLPGFKHDQHSMAHIFIQANLLIKDDELGLLSKYGLKYIYPEIPLMSIFPDGQTLALYTNRQKTYEEVARFSKRDAESYLKLSQLGETYLPAIVGGMFCCSAPTGAMYAFMDQSKEGRLMMKIMQKSAYDIVKEYFSDERVLLHFTRIVSENLTGPEEKGTGIGLFVFLAFLEKYGIGVAQGGSGMLSQALIRCIEDHGGKVMSQHQRQQGADAAKAARLATTHDGRTFNAKDGVIGAIHPHDIGKFIDGIDADVVKAAEERRTHRERRADSPRGAQRTAEVQVRRQATQRDDDRAAARPHRHRCAATSTTSALRPHPEGLLIGARPVYTSIRAAHLPARRRCTPGTTCRTNILDGGAEAWTRRRTLADAMLEKMSHYIRTCPAQS